MGITLGRGQIGIDAASERVQIGAQYLEKSHDQERRDDQDEDVSRAQAQNSLSNTRKNL